MDGIIVVNKKMVFIFLIILITIFVLLQLYHKNLYDIQMVMGGKFYLQVIEEEENKIINEKIDVEKYFRPSKLPVLNDRNLNMGFSNYYGKEHNEIILPENLFETPEDTIVNYFSVLREAANPQEGKWTGCGTLGKAKLPYPMAYNFLSSEYQEKLSYNNYLKTFENILHINLIKFKEVPLYKEYSNKARYFVEIETIEGSGAVKDVAYFAYYYGYLDIVKEENKYKISDIEFYGENYLCAPYHGWNYDAESVVNVKYGYWCSLVKEIYQVKQIGFIKNIYFKGTDGNDYLIQFYQLTNDTDIEIAQYMKSEGGDWKLIQIDTEKCLDK